MPHELEELNDRQREAVERVEGPMLILAGAGSGKTRVITNRVAYLLQSGIQPDNVLALSFTNKAAEEMRERVAELTGKDLADRVHLSTFHSLGAEILRRDIDVLGYDRPFTILDQGDQQAVVERVMEEASVPSDAVGAGKVRHLISRAKMNFSEPNELDEFKFDPARPAAQRVYEKYVEALEALNAVDFDDLIRLPIRIFREHEAIRQKYGDQFQYVMVDEYQDTNETQLLFLEELVRDHQNLCVVGDDDQSIYGFRGALAENIDRFEREFGGAEVIKLEQNYRSTNNILRAANGLIRNNAVRKSKELWSQKGEGEQVRYVECDDGEEEAEFVAAEIERMAARHRLEYRDFAILYRINHQSKPFEKALNNQRVPFQVRGSTEFFDRREVKDVVAYLRVLLNPRDELSLRRIVNVPSRGIGPTLLGRIDDLGDRRGQSLFEALSTAADDPSTVDRLGYAAGEKLGDFVETIRRFRARSAELDGDREAAAQLCRDLLEALDFFDHIRSQADNDADARRRVENVREVVDAIGSVDPSSEDPLRDFVEGVALDASRASEPDEDRDAVRLMTLHSAKGLEFPAVFVVGMEKDYLPHSENQRKPKDVAEERRLAYVGMTRAQRYLTLTSASTRTRYGQEIEREVRQFVGEIPEDVLEVQRARDAESLAEQRDERNKAGIEAMKEIVGD
ncbi:MAG: ATP-dependent helicase [Bradymonadaceae bacterium]